MATRNFPNDNTQRKIVHSLDLAHFGGALTSHLEAYFVNNIECNWEGIIEKCTRHKYFSSDAIFVVAG